MIMNGELRWMWNKVLVTYFEILSQRMNGVKVTIRACVRIAVLCVLIQTQYLRCVKHEL